MLPFSWTRFLKLLCQSLYCVSTNISNRWFQDLGKWFCFIFIISYIMIYFKLFWNSWNQRNLRSNTFPNSSLSIKFFIICKRLLSYLNTMVFQWKSSKIRFYWNVHWFKNLLTLVEKSSWIILHGSIKQIKQFHRSEKKIRICLFFPIGFLSSYLRKVLFLETI